MLFFNYRGAGYKTLLLAVYKTSDVFFLKMTDFWQIFDLWWPLVTSRQIFLKTSRQELHFWGIISLFSIRLEIWPIWPLSAILTFDDLQWPRDKFFENPTPRASFWGILSLFSIKFEIWPIWPFFVIFDLQWPRLNLRILFLKLSCQELHFDV